MGARAASSRFSPPTASGAAGQSLRRGWPVAQTAAESRRAPAATPQYRPAEAEPPRSRNPEEREFEAWPLRRTSQSCTEDRIVKVLRMVTLGVPEGTALELSARFGSGPPRGRSRPRGRILAMQEARSVPVLFRQCGSPQPVGKGPTPLGDPTTNDRGHRFSTRMASWAGLASRTDGPRHRSSRSPSPRSGSRRRSPRGGSRRPPAGDTHPACLLRRSSPNCRSLRRG